MLSTIYLVAAVIGGTILVCQFVLALIGLGHDGVDLSHDAAGDFHAGGHDGGLFDSHHGGDSHAGADQHADSTHLFAVVSFRTVVAAAAFFGVTGLATLEAGFPATTTLVMAAAAGTFAMYGMYRLLRLIAGLGSSGNERIGNAVGLTGTVYIPIPASGKAAGKVQLSMQNRIVEYLAVTDESEALKTGETVRIVGIKNGDTVQVCRVAQSAAKEPVVC
jgi:hypothetical protein